MKFGQSENPENINFLLPPDDPRTAKILKQNDPGQPMNVYVGCAKWNKTDLKNFYPKGVKDELAYYSTQFNSIELNATFYRVPSPDQVINWKDKTPEGFKFFPKINQLSVISADSMTFRLWLRNIAITSATLRKS